MATVKVRKTSVRIQLQKLGTKALYVSCTSDSTFEILPLHVGNGAKTILTMMITTMITYSCTPGPGCIRPSKDKRALTVCSGTITYCFEIIECFHSRGQHLCKFIGTKESVCIRKDFSSQRTGLGHQHDRCDVVWKHSIVTSSLNLEMFFCTPTQTSKLRSSLVSIFFCTISKTFCYCCCLRKIRRVRGCVQEWKLTTNISKENLMAILSKFN